MAGALEEAYSRLEAKVAERTRELVAANDQLKELDKLKSRFLSNVSHELKTPLTAIVGLAANMLDGITGRLNDKQREYLSDIRASSDRLARLIKDLLDLVDHRGGEGGAQASAVRSCKLGSGSCQQPQACCRAEAHQHRGHIH
jgi:signal transduction histidine kinase